MDQKWYISHAETLCQNVVGMAIGFMIMHLWGIPVMDGIKLQVIFFFASYIRGYTIRRLFNRYWRFK